MIVVPATTTAEEALSMFEETGADGVMIGRGAMNNPWIFSQIVELANGHAVPRPSAEDRERLVDQHLRLMIDFFRDDRSTVHMLKKYLCAYSTGLPGASDFRNRVNRADELDSLVRQAQAFFQAAA